MAITRETRSQEGKQSIEVACTLGHKLIPGCLWDRRQAKGTQRVWGLEAHTPEMWDPFWVSFKNISPRSRRKKKISIRDGRVREKRKKFLQKIPSPLLHCLGSEITYPLWNTNIKDKKKALKCQCPQTYTRSKFKACRIMN